MAAGVWVDEDKWEREGVIARSESREGCSEAERVCPGIGAEDGAAESVESERAVSASGARGCEWEGGVEASCGGGSCC